MGTGRDIGKPSVAHELPAIQAIVMVHLTILLHPQQPQAIDRFIRAPLACRHVVAHLYRNRRVRRRQQVRFDPWKHAQGFQIRVPAGFLVEPEQARALHVEIRIELQPVIRSGSTDQRRRAHRDRRGNRYLRDPQNQPCGHDQTTNTLHVGRFPILAITRNR